VTISRSFVTVQIWGNGTRTDADNQPHCVFVRTQFWEASMIP